MKGTNIYFLSGIPGNPPKEVEDVWLGDDPDMHSVGKFNILSEIDLLIETANITTESVKLANIYNQLDLLATILYGYEMIANGNQDAFKNVCRKIAGMAGENHFLNDSSDLDFRKSHLDKLKAELSNRCANDYTGSEFDMALYQWLEKEVHAKMYASISGRKSPLEVANGIKKSAPYFLYRFLTPDQLRRVKPIVKKKLAVQNKTHVWFRDHNGYFDERAQNNLVRSGIISQSKLTPEQLIRYMAYNKAQFSQMGSITLATVYTIVQLVAVLAGLISTLKKIFGKKRNPPTDAEIEGSFGNSADLGGLYNNSETENTNPETADTDESAIDKTNKNLNEDSRVKKYLPLLVGARILFFLSKNNS